MKKIDLISKLQGLPWNAEIRIRHPEAGVDMPIADLEFDLDEEVYTLVSK